jgi:hypothetical protein
MPQSLIILCSILDFLKATSCNSSISSVQFVLYGQLLLQFWLDICAGIAYE